MIVRLAGWAGRFLACCSVLGISAACKIFLQGRFGTKVRTIVLPGGQRFKFRGRLDKGVVSHFYSEGYHFEGGETGSIRRILDCGANIGDETARFLAHQPQAEIAAVEPAVENFRLLEENFAGHRQVRLFHGAVWPSETRLKIIRGDTPEGFRAQETHETNGDSLPAWTIPKLMEQLGWDEIDVLKIDIEGAEYELFRAGFEAWITKVKILIFEVGDNPASAQVIFRALGDRPFGTFACGENLVLIRQNVPWKLKRVVGFEKNRRQSPVL